MDRNSIWKWLILVALLMGSLALVYPPSQKISYGLDLQGGTSFLLEVDDTNLDEDGKRDAQERALEVIRNRVDQLGIAEPIIYAVPDGKRIVVQLPGLKEEQREQAIKLIQSAAFLEFRMVHEDNDELTDNLLAEGLAPKGYKIVTIEEAQFDGSMRPVRYYKPIMEEGSDSETLEKDQKDILRRFEPVPGHEFMLMKVLKQGQAFYRPHYVSRRREMTGEGLASASIQYNPQTSQPYVSLAFNADGKKRFARITSDYALGGAKNPSAEQRRQMAIILDGTLYSAPAINEPIYGGNAIIEGSFTVPEATRLSIALRAGALPAPVNMIDARHVDPTLGHDSITSGTRAIIYGGAGVLVFMLLYYMVAGIVANLALILDMLLLPLGMMIAAGTLGLFTGEAASTTGSAMKLPTLTLPGIAGIVLTIGMAVDANVLIFERIREEQRAGKRFKAAVAAGYDRAFSTIFDANITTLLTAMILFWQGSGPIKGFAVTLSAGIIVSMYVALVVTRMFFNTIGDKTNIQSLKMMSIIRDSKINFISMRWAAAVLSIGLIIGTWTTFFTRGVESNFGVDFTGGSAITFEFDQKASVEDVRDALNAAGVDEAFIQYQRDLAPDAQGDQHEHLELKVGYEEGDLSKEVLLTSFSDNGYRVVKEDSVGPQIGKELQKKGIWAIVSALIGIVIYISVRFEFAFAMGAIAALAHDVLITVGIYCLLGRQLSLPIVAALLTIVGYSVNDTIVVFDRIREDLQLIRDKSYADIANLSINQTLSRTLLTSVTTLITVVMLLVFGGGAINDFAVALLIGILVGTYSSIFVATPVMLMWHKEKKAA